jgi:hypothetical protein
MSRGCRLLSLGTALALAGCSGSTTGDGSGTPDLGLGATAFVLGTYAGTGTLSVECTGDASPSATTTQTSVQLTADGKLLVDGQEATAGAIWSNQDGSQDTIAGISVTSNLVILQIEKQTAAGGQGPALIALERVDDSTIRMSTAALIFYADTELYCRLNGVATLRR